MREQTGTRSTRGGGQEPWRRGERGWQRSRGQNYGKVGKSMCVSVAHTPRRLETWKDSQGFQFKELGRTVSIFFFFKRAAGGGGTGDLFPYVFVDVDIFLKYL